MGFSWNGFGYELVSILSPDGDEYIDPSCPEDDSLVDRNPIPLG